MTSAEHCDQISSGYAQLAFTVVPLSRRAADWCAERANVWAGHADFHRSLSPWMGLIASTVAATQWMWGGAER